MGDQRRADSPTDSASLSSSGESSNPQGEFVTSLRDGPRSSEAANGRKRRYSESESEESGEIPPRRESSPDPKVVKEKPKKKSKKKKKKKKEKDKSKHEKTRGTKRKRRSHSKERKPVQLSQFLHGEEKYSVISGKKIKMKVEKTKEDKEADRSRQQLLEFLNASYD